MYVYVWCGDVMALTLVIRFADCLSGIFYRLDAIPEANDSVKSLLYVTFCANEKLNNV